MHSFLPMYMYSLGYNQLTNSLMLSIAATFYLLIQPSAGYRADRFDPVQVIFAEHALSAGGMFFVPCTAGAALGAAWSCGGIGVGIIWTNTDAVVSSLVIEGVWQRRLARQAHSKNWEICWAHS
jgi:MFS transporter, ACDE family, multidrug resistance protein